MPMYTKTVKVHEFAEPEIFFQYGPTKIYHTYTPMAEDYPLAGRMNHLDYDCRSKRLFSTNKCCGLVPRFNGTATDQREWNDNIRFTVPTKFGYLGVFNIQNILNPNEHHITTHVGIKRLLREAIIDGRLRQNMTPECVHKDCHIMDHPE